MSETVEQAREGLERAAEDALERVERAEVQAMTEVAEAAGKRRDRFPVRVAILISCLAAALAITEMGEKSAQNEYLTRHVTVSDDWAFYQAKTLRWNIVQNSASLLESLPNAADPAVQKRIAAMHDEAARLNDDEKTQGRKQLQEQARRQTEIRNQAFERYHSFEFAVGALQIAIVLASVSVVTRMLPMAYAAGIIGGAAALFALLVQTAGVSL